MAPSFFQPEQATVCVMDASGSLGSALVQRQLKLGYSVHAAVQNLGDMQQLKAAFPRNEKLKTITKDNPHMMRIEEQITAKANELI